MSVDDGVIRVLPHATRDAVRVTECDVDEQRLRAYAAGIGDTRPELFDLDRAAGILGHPLFAASLEWPLVEKGAPGIHLSANTLLLGLHVAHRMRIHAPLRPGHRFRTEARLSTAEARRNAALVATEFRTYTDRGALAVTTLLHMLYPNVVLHGAPDTGRSEAHRAIPTAPLLPIAEFTVDATNAVVYTECARIGNPIHTDVRQARAAGLPDTVLHGTEILARAVSAVSRTSLARVTEIACRFTGPVFPGNTLTVAAAPTSRHTTVFQVHTRDNRTVLSDGYVTWAPDESCEARDARS